VNGGGRGLEVVGVGWWGRLWGGGCCWGGDKGGGGAGGGVEKGKRREPNKDKEGL